MRVTSTISSKQPAASIYGCPGLRGPIQPLISLWLRSAIRIWAYPASVGSFFTISAATSCVACLLSQSAVPFPTGMSYLYSLRQLSAHASFKGGGRF